MEKQDFDYCERCSGEGVYWFDSDIFYSWGTKTHQYMAECDECYGSGKIYEEPEEE